MLRIWSWNVNGRAVWDRLTSGDVDVALLQEAPPPPGLRNFRTAPDAEGEWRTSGWRTRRRTAVISVSDSIRFAPWRETGLQEREPGALMVSRPGTLAAADISLDGNPVTLVSMYAAWDTSLDRRLIYADAAAHRLLSDLAMIVTTRRSHRVIAAGDLNILNRYGEYGRAYWAARYSTVFDRAEAMGLVFVGPQSPNGRQAHPRPWEVPETSLDVPTYHTAQQGPMGAARQLDFVFASESLVDQLNVRALNADTDEWGPSDHCRVLIELLTGR